MNETFLYETSLAKALEAAAIPGLLVKINADVTGAKMSTIVRPTAIVSLFDEKTKDGNRDAVLVEVTMEVALVLRGATAKADERDLFFREEVFQALHGAELPGLASELLYQDTKAGFEDGCRMYSLTFTGLLRKQLRTPAQAR